MFALRPGVRKINVQRGGGLRWQKIFQKVRRLDADTPEIRQSSATPFAVQLANAPSEALHTDEIVFRMRFGLVHQERSVAAAEFHFQGLNRWEIFRDVKWLKNRAQFDEQTVAADVRRLHFQKISFAR